MMLKACGSDSSTEQKIDMTSGKDPVAIANESGYPLQIAIENQVKNTADDHGWKVRYVEHAWTNTLDQETGYADLVLQDQHGSTFFVVDCKRPRQATWLFMRSDGAAKDRRHAKAWVTHFDGERLRRFGWHDMPVDPSFPEANFCAVRGQSENDRPMLERTAGILVRATEALAHEERDYRPEKQPTIRFYFSVIVTTADLKVARFDPARISLSDGTLEKADVIDVPFVRFRKQLLARANALTPQDYGDGNDPGYARESTVFVVHADAFTRFLSEFDVPHSSFKPFV